MDEQNTFQKNNTIVFQRTNDQDILQELVALDLYSKLEIITYISGATMLRNEDARNEVENFLLTNNTILLSDLLFSHDFAAFRCEYKFIFYSLISMDKPLNPSGELEFDFGNKTKSSCNFGTDFEAFISDFHNNCFELYFPTEINIPVAGRENDRHLLYGIAHPLVENPFLQDELPLGELILLRTNYIVDMSYINIEENFLETHTQNVFITRLRPMSRDCDYGDFSPSFFESFLSTD